MDHVAAPQPQPQPQPPVAPGPKPKAGKSIGQRIGGALATLAAIIAVKVGLGMWHEDQADKNAADYAVGSCLSFDKKFMPKASDVHEVSCSSSSARVKVAKKYQGARDCPNDNYATLEFGKFGMCMQEQFTVGKCYGGLGGGLAEETTCGESIVSHNFKVLSRHDSDNAGLCSGADESALTYPTPPLTYCVQSLYVELKPLPPPTSAG